MALLSAWVLLCCASAEEEPAEIHVPIDVPTLEDAVDRAGVGDVVLVHPGDYVLDESLRVWRKCFTLRSTGGPEVTTIRMPLKEWIRPVRARLIEVINPPEEMVIEGFTFLLDRRQDGVRFCLECGEFGWLWTKPGLILRGNVFRHKWKNWWNFEYMFGERGVYALGPGLIEDNEFSDLDTGIDASWVSRKIPGELVVRNNHVRQCFAGIVCGGAGVSIIGNTVEDCSRGMESESEARLIGNVVRNCRSGLRASYSKIIGNSISAREAAVGLPGGGSEFLGNTIICRDGHAFRGSTGRDWPNSFDRNTIIYGPGGGFDISGDSTYKIAMRNTILWPSPGAESAYAFLTRDPEGQEPYSEGNWGKVEITASHCVIYGNPLGEGPGIAGITDSDPMFVDLEAGDVRLLPGSPCIDAGDAESEPDPDGSPADIGALFWDRRAPVFLRGDGDGDGRLLLGDAVGLLGWIFGWNDLLCPRAGDFNDDGRLALDDAVGLLRLLFAGGPLPPPPYPVAGEDETPDRLPCGR